jgi:hypothetical protein
MIKTFGAQPFASNGAAARSLGKPSAVYPGAVATDSSLAIAVDRQQTRLALPLNATDTSMTVADPSVIVAYCLLTIDAETVKVTGAPAGNVVPISRGFDGTTPALHLASATVSGFIDAYHHNTLVAEIEAIETALGPNLSRVPTTALTVSSAYNFAPLTPGGSLTVGTNVITLAPVPQGVNGTDKSHYLWVDQGTGTPEAVLITGGTAVAGAPSGTLFFTCANTHTGAWRISSATAGIQEAIQSLDTGGNGGTVLIPAGNWPTHAPITIDARFISLQGSGMGATIITADLSVCPAVQIGTGTRGVPVYNGITNLTVTRAAGTIPTNCIGVLWLFYNMGYTQNVEYSRHYVGEKTTHPGGSITIGFLSDGCRMWGCSRAYLWCEHVAGVKYSRLYMGAAGETQAGQTAPVYGVIISADANDIKFNHCDWLSPVTAPATAMQWGVLFTAMPAGTGMFIFNDCNWENIAQGVFTSDATCTGLNWLELNAGRSGNAGSLPFMQFNAATVLQQINIRGVTISGTIQLTNPKYSMITNCFMGSALTVTGGDILISNNVFPAQPVLTGNFSCLNLGPNSYVFNGANMLVPTLAGATGTIYVNENNAADTPNLNRTLAGSPEGVGLGASGGTLALSDNLFAVISGGTVSTLTLPYPNFTGVVYLACAQAVTFATGGNIATGLTATIGQLVIAAYSKTQAKWYLK